MNTKIILIIGLLFLSLQGLGQVNPTAAIKPAPGENYILISRDTFGAARFVYDSIEFRLSNDTLYLTDSIKLDLSSISGSVEEADGATITGVGSSGDPFKVDTLLIATQSDISNFGSGTVTGSGTTNYLSKWTSGTALGNSLFFDNGTNTGIGTISPTSKLHIQSDGTSTGKSFFVENSIGTDNFTILDNGNVGIGTASPSVALEVDGTINGTGEIKISPDTDFGGVIGRTKFYSLVGDYSYISHYDHANSTGFAFRISPAGNTDFNAPTGSFISFRKNNVGKMWLTDSGFGIGTFIPTQDLHVEGNARITGAIYDSNNSAGSNGQVLSTTATGTDWIDNTNIYSADGTLTANRTITSTGQYLEYSAFDGTDINITKLADNGNTFALTDTGSGAVSNLSHKPEDLKLTGSPFKIVSDNNDQLFITDTESNSTTKTGSMVTNHYTNIEEPFLWLRAQSGSSFNTLRFGGGDSGGNAATVIDFHTASNNTTTTGTRRMRIDNAGTVNFSEFIEIDQRSTVPSSPATGTVYMDDGTNTGGTPTLRYYNGTSWVNM